MTNTSRERETLIKELLLLKFHVGGDIGDIVKRAADMLEADAQDENFATDMLAMMFDKYENGVACYEDPDDCAGALGNAVQLDPADFCRITEFLNKTRPIQAPQTKAQQVAVPATGDRLSDGQIVDWMWGRDLNRLNEDQREQVFLLIRDVEAHHGIGAKQ